MKTSRYFLLAATGLLLVISTTGLAVKATAAEVKVLSTIAAKSLFSAITPKFQHATGDILTIDFDTAAALQKKIESDEPFDVAILTDTSAAALIQDGKIMADTRLDFARIGIGLAIRTGAPKPDIGTAGTFMDSLLKAKSIAYANDGASGTAFASVLRRLGIDSELKSRIKLVPAAGVMALVALGKAELGVQLINEIAAAPGVELLGPLPPGLQSFIVLTAGAATSSKEPEAAKALIQFLRSPPALFLIKAKGMESG